MDCVCELNGEQFVNFDANQLGRPCRHIRDFICTARPQETSGPAAPHLHSSDNNDNLKPTTTETEKWIFIPVTGRLQGPIIIIIIIRPEMADAENGERGKQW